MFSLLSFRRHADAFVSVWVLFDVLTVFGTGKYEEKKRYILKRAIFNKNYFLIEIIYLLKVCKIKICLFITFFGSQ